MTGICPKPLLAVAAAALLTGAAACGSSSSSSAKASPSATSMSGTESFTGSATGKAAVANNTTFPLTWSGPVKTASTFSTGGSGPKKGQHHTFKTAAGNFVVVVSGKPTTVQHASATTCYFSQVGTGTAVVTFAAYGPKLSNGKCNQSNSAVPLAKGASATFKGTGPLTVKS